MITTIMKTKHCTSTLTPHTDCQHGGGGVRIWACSEAQEHLAVNEPTSNFSVFQSVLEFNVNPKNKAATLQLEPRPQSDWTA